MRWACTTAEKIETDGAVKPPKIAWFDMQSVLQLRDHARLASTNWTILLRVVSKHVCYLFINFSVLPLLLGITSWLNYTVRGHRYIIRVDMHYNYFP